MDSQRPDRAQGACEIVDKFRKLLVQGCARPPLYTGSHSLQDFATFLNGYVGGARDAGSPIGFERFQRWVESRFGIFSPAWNWVRILQHVYGDDQTAFKELPGLYDEFIATTSQMTDEELLNLVQTKMLELRGDKYWCPSDQETWTKPTYTAKKL